MSQVQLVHRADLVQQGKRALDQAAFKFLDLYVGDIRRSLAGHRGGDNGGRTLLVAGVVLRNQGEANLALLVAQYWFGVHGDT